MSPVQTVHCNSTYTAPAGMTAEECGDLPCERDTPRGAIKSWWETTPRERELISAGGLIRFTCYANHHPVIALEVHGSAAPPEARDPGEYERTYQETWKELIEPGGVLDMDALKRELHDYQLVMSEVSKAYCEITRSRLSKPNTRAQAIIDEVDERLAEATTNQETKVLSAILAAIRHCPPSAQLKQMPYGYYVIEDQGQQLGSGITPTDAWLDTAARPQDTAPSLPAH